ncbi:lanthionine synthetase C family protein [Kribbella sindirgiensis]|uniref:Lanthionine synthetase n=1 Tax=Kribbella sindirgiensis TaxID=1124744 RepID=A0A4R0HYK7_9ACTN|nr:lanthionine synthetase C family protein [Kribbella sindirgiensis]TCC17124.1 lanthionine synthetase [Kribbella sindirgiensis]
MTAATRQLTSTVASQSLGRGTAGQALLHIEQARIGYGSWRRVHEHIIKMTGAPVAAHSQSCLFEGAPAIAYVLATAEQAAYESALATLDSHIDELTRERLQRAHRRIESGLLPGLREFDLISGLTGLGVYQLRRRRGGEVLHDVLEYLVRLCEPLTLDDQALPGWWTANDIADHPSASWPGGHGNLGIAHGISGPLALMAMAARRGMFVRGQLEAIASICVWLDRWQQGNGETAWWPGTITKRELDTDHLEQAGPQRPSWCYGTPGLVRAQQLAGLALDDQSRQHKAETALLGCVTDNAQLDQLSDTTLCHGWAGLVQATQRVAADAGARSPLTAQLSHLTRRLDELAFFDGSMHRPDLLEGRTGIRLVQISATSTVDSKSNWDACLLLSG